MDLNSPQFLRCLTCAIWTLFVLIFAWLYAREREDRSRLWLVGWVAIECHFAAGLLAGFSLISARLSDWLAYTTILISASAFFLSVSASVSSWKRLLVFWACLFIPAELYWTLLVFDYPQPAAYIGLLLITFVAGGLLALAHRNRGLALMLWGALGALPALFTIAYRFQPGNGMDLFLFQAFAISGCAYWLRFRRVSPGVVLTSASFLFWSLVWPGGDLLAMLHVTIRNDHFLWDLPKYMVAVGMIITLFEEQAESLQREIRERQQAEDALRRSENWLRESQRVSRIGSYAVDMATGAWSGSETVAEILGLDLSDYAFSASAMSDSARGTVSQWEELIHPDYRDEMAAHFRNGKDPDDEPFDRECLILRRRDSQERWVQWRGALVRDANQRSTLTGTVQDITERKNIEQQLLQARKMESIGRLAGGVAHDFNNLLTVINGYSDILLHRLPPNEPLRSRVSEIRDAGKRAADLTYQLLAFSRRQFLQPRVLDLNAIVADTERLLKRLIGENIHLSTTLYLNLGRVEADPSQITQVLINLAVNARDAMPQGGSLTIETGNVDGATLAALPGAEVRAGCYARISVVDNGTGMNQETQQQLFEPFFTTKPRGQGTGLGLSTVYGIVRQSGGCLEVRSELGSGSAFSIYLPCVDSPILVEPSPALPAPEEFGTETILVVEDQASVRKLIASILDASGYRTLQAGSGEEALGVAASFPEPIALVISDVVMPGMSGQALVEHLRPLRPETAAILISGYTEDVLAKHMANRDLAFLHKPFSPDALRGKIREVLRARENTIQPEAIR